MRPCLLLALTCCALTAAVTGDDLTQLAIPLRDGTKSLADWQGRVVYLDIWATWCAPCRKSLPWMATLQQKYADRGLTVIAVSIDQQDTNLDRFLAREPVTGILIGHDATATIAKTLQPPKMPTSYLIARDGRLHSIHDGLREEDRALIEREIVALLEDAATDPPSEPES